MPRCFIQIAGSLALALAAAGCVPLHAQTSARVPLTGAAVAAMLAQTGLRVDANQIELPGSLSTATANPQLHVTGAELLPEGPLRVRLACREARDCQPFLATIRSASAPEAMANFTGLQKSLQTTSSPRSIAVTERVLAGQHATLLLEDIHMRITVPVLVIDSGAPGTEVRVSSLDRKQIFRAVVADAGTLRGTLQ